MKLREYKRLRKLYTKRERELKQKEFPKLKRQLLKHGGKLVVPMYEEDLKKILQRGKIFKNKAILKLGKSNDCHGNTAREHIETGCKIITGWALSPDQLWRQHSWCLQKNKIIETTESRKKYYGILLTEKESEQFIEENR